MVVSFRTGKVKEWGRKLPLLFELWKRNRSIKDLQERIKSAKASNAYWEEELRKLEQTLNQEMLHQSIFVSINNLDP